MGSDGLDFCNIDHCLPLHLTKIWIQYLLCKYIVCKNWKLLQLVVLSFHIRKLQSPFITTLVVAVYKSAVLDLDAHVHSPTKLIINQ